MFVACPSAYRPDTYADHADGGGPVIKAAHVCNLSPVVYEYRFKPRLARAAAFWASRYVAGRQCRPASHSDSNRREELKGRLLGVNRGKIEIAMNVRTI